MQSRKDARRDLLDRPCGPSALDFPMFSEFGSKEVGEIMDVKISEPLTLSSGSCAKIVLVNFVNMYPGLIIDSKTR